MILTGAGQEVLVLFERMEAAIASCAASLDMIAGRSGERVSIGAVSTTKHFEPFAMAAFSKLHPRIDTSLSIGNRQEIRQALRGYELDFAIMGRSPSDIEVDTHLIRDHPHVIIALKGHWLAGDLDSPRWTSRKNQFEQELTVRALRKHKVELISFAEPLANDANGDMFRKFIGIVNEFRSAETARATTRTMKENARRGYSNTTASSRSATSRSMPK